MRNRSWRRHQRARMKKRARRFAWINEKYNWDLGRLDYPSRLESERRYEQNSDHLCVCSCWMCGNPRRNKWISLKDRITIPEKKALDIYRQQIEENFGE